MCQYVHVLLGNDQYPPVSDTPPSPQTPILSYSAFDPHRVFLTAYKATREDEVPLEVTHVHQLQWVTSANAVTRPQLLDMIQIVVGIEQIVYLYAKVCKLT